MYTTWSAVYLQYTDTGAVGDKDHVECVIDLLRVVTMLSLHCVLDIPRELVLTHVSAIDVCIHLICSTCDMERDMC